LLPKRQRIRRGIEIKQILKQKQIHFSSPLLSLSAIENSLAEPRLVVVCSKKIGSAVVRNRVRRVVTAAFASIWHNIGKKVDMVIVPRSINASLADYAGEILRVNARYT